MSDTTVLTDQGGTDYSWLPADYSVSAISTNGVRLSAAVGGSGPTIVLLHGWPETGRAWRHVMPDLAVKYTVVVPDLRGAGMSERPEDGYRKTNQADDIRGLLDGLGLSGPTIVVGHDIGAMVALAFAEKYPQDVTALVVLDVILPGLGLEQSMNVAEGGMWHFGLFMTPHVPEMLFDGHELEFISTSFQGMSNPGTFSAEDLAFYARSYTGRDRLRGGFLQYQTLLDDGKDNRALLAEKDLDMPVLAIGGGDRMSASMAAALGAHAPKLVAMAAPTGHFVAEEDPEWFLATVDDFLVPHDPAAA